ncbi:MAG: RNA-binding protein [Chitinophagaceae bacterium]|nr:MAG: RNA-binding protein [Chitinophagaceae bacterium]
MKYRFLLFFILVNCWSHAQKPAPLFQRLSSSHTGIDFANNITENDTLNILNQANIYNGGGVGVGDFNNDGLQDVYFAGNMMSNKLYINKGSLKFEDLTETAGVGGEGRWCTGVSVVDINADGWLDIYVSASFWKDAQRRTNLLYLNQGLNKEGIPVFKEVAKEWGLADEGFSTQGYFFDYDRDGDLDMYQLTNALYDPKTPIRFRPKVTNGTALNTDRLYRNNGNGTFTNVSAKAGILLEGWGHAASISDFNGDGWPDIYVANDFVSNDILYINNRDGTFSDRITHYFKHTGWNAMGTDVVDINNDGFPDVISLEMLPESNLRKKRMLGGNEYYNYFNASQYGYQHQYVRNVLQLSSGQTPLGHPVFSDVAFQTGLYQTDWSWCPLVADFDNDGWRDIIITNGLPRDVTDLDYIAYNSGQGGGAAELTLAKAHTLPVVNIPNYAFKNMNGLQFQNTSAAWGLDEEAFSNGGAYADLDNDGDLDLLVNNINGAAFVYENKSNSVKSKAANTLILKLAGEGKNRNAIGAKVSVYTKGATLYYEHQPMRGYLSTVDDRAYFGLGANTAADSVKIVWPNGKVSLLTNVPANTPYAANQKEGANTNQAGKKANTLFARANTEYGIHYTATESDFVDYNIQSTLPHKLSQYGPGIAVGDIDGNGREDFYVGGSSGNPGKFFLQGVNGKFRMDSTRIQRQGKELHEEMGVLFFDADGDGDLDLYTVTGSYEIPPDHAVGQDRLFLNNGKGFFQLAQGALPAETTNGSTVRSADFDGDGDLDLFVGGRVVSGSYPSTPQSFLLENRGGKFVDVTQKLCPELQNIGMITDALWSDFDNDGKVDLVVTGEWMPVTLFRNAGASFQPVASSGVDQHLGWWNSLTAGDFDNDGDIDYVAGNLGLNSSYTATAAEPMTLLAKDIDNNGSLDAMVFCYMKAEDGSRKPFPMHAKDDLTGQLIAVRKLFPTYTSYGKATLTDLWPEKAQQGAIKKMANFMASAYLENKGSGQFVLTPLPAAAQTAPVYGALAEDVNGDGNLDLLLVGNDYGMEPYSGRHDAFNGLCLLGTGKGDFEPLPVGNSGFFVPGDAKGLSRLYTAKGEAIWIASQNNDSLIVHKKVRKQGKWLPVKKDDFSATMTMKNGAKQQVEFYYGSSFLSQSSRHLFVPDEVRSVTVTNYKGQKRELL